VYAALGLALISKGEGRFEEAAEQLSKLVKGDPKNYRLYIDLADCYLKMHRKQDAVETLKTFTRQGLKNQAVAEFLEEIQMG
jgi:predicted Zn-dependent protease